MGLAGIGMYCVTLTHGARVSGNARPCWIPGAIKAEAHRVRLIELRQLTWEAIKLELCTDGRGNDCAGIVFRAGSVQFVYSDNPLPIAPYSRSLIFCLVERYDMIRHRDCARYM